MDNNPTFNNQILYKPHSNGKLGTWRICVSQLEDGSAAYISYAAKVIGGKEKETLTNITEGKQKRSPYEQALSEAESKYKTQLRKGYSVDKPEEGAKPKNTLGFNIAVKAQKWHEVDHKPPYRISPKLDGHHMSAAIRDGKVVLYSMNSKELDIAHIQKVLQQAYDNGYWNGKELDGELYRHGLELDEIKSRITKTHEEHHLLQFHMYDIMDHDKPYEERYLNLLEFFFNGLTSDAVVEVEWHYVHRPEDVDTFHKKWLAQSYEGSMIRWGKAGYADSARSKYLLKKKDYQDAEFKVVSWKLGKPKFKNGVQYERPVLRCVAENGKEFNVSLHGDMVETNQMYKDGLDKYLGSMYTVKFFKINISGAPSQPIGLRFRNDI